VARKTFVSRYFYFAFSILVSSAYQEAEAQQENAFDASSFQNPDYMSAIYNGTNIPNAYLDAFKRYVFGFVNELGNERTLLMDSHCAPLTKTALNLSNMSVFRDIVPEVRSNFGNSILG